MDHTSGLESDPVGNIADNEQTLRLSLQDAVTAYAHQPLRYEPGTKWMYSNVGIATLGRIIEVISGEDYIQFISGHILEPLGMADTYFNIPENERDRLAYVYKHVDGKLALSGPGVLAGDSTKFRPNMKYPAPEFGLYSTAADLDRFYQMLLNGGTYNGVRFLTKQSIETMTRVFTPDDVKPTGWLGGTATGLHSRSSTNPRARSCSIPLEHSATAAPSEPKAGSTRSGPMSSGVTSAYARTQISRGMRNKREYSVLKALVFAVPSTCSSRKTASRMCRP